MAEGGFLPPHKELDLGFSKFLAAWKNWTYGLVRSKVFHVCKLDVSNPECSLDLHEQWC